MKYLPSLLLALLGPLSAGASADLLWTGAASNDLFDEGSWDLSGSSVTLVDPNVSIEDDVRIIGTLVPAEIPNVSGQQRFQLGDGRTLLLDAAEVFEAGNDGIGGAPGTTVGADVVLRNGSHLRTFFITNRIRLDVGALCTATFDGGHVPINGSTVNMTAGATLVFTDELPVDFLNEHLNRISVDGSPAVVGTNLQVVPDGAAGCRVTVLSQFPSWCGGDQGVCPCGNDNDGSNGLAGCRNGTHAGGASLDAAGSESMAAADLVLFATGLPAGATGVFFQGNLSLNNGQGFLFGDGLRCAGQAVRRLQVVQADASGFVASSVDIATQGSVGGGVTRYYQLWYGDALGTPCGLGFNTTNARSVSWAP